MKQGDRAGAIADFTQTIRIKPYNSNAVAIAYSRRAKVHQASGDLDKAIADFTEAMRLEPKSGDLYANRAYCYGDKEAYQDAIKDAERYLELQAAFITKYPANPDYIKLRQALTAWREGRRE